MRCFTRFLVCLALTASLVLAGDPDFSGTWTLDEARSENLRLSVERWNTMKVLHQDAGIRCFPIAADAQATKSQSSAGLNFATDGKETVHKVGAGSGKSVAKWEGAALLINTIVSGAPRGYTQMDRWKLSRDGNLLTIRRQIITLHGETESTLVYKKQ